MHPGAKKQALDMQHRFKIDDIPVYNAIKPVKQGCPVCQARYFSQSECPEGSPMDAGS